ncbi:unnamed protein product [Rotaria sordida]|uniref:Lipocalin/cytosolic fatty-acid binding domain-containing protein n=2 Tax=Rotaria sordida TaxID=392033 RepID=A0A819QAE3_9BILA|nr:unnamed protein product [Rotaria sordida]
MTSAASAIEKLKGTWDYVDGENFDEYLKEMGISWAIRQAAKAVKKEKMIISVNDNGRWILKSESTFKNTVYEFTPGIEFNETRADGEEVKSIITFDNNTGRWIHEATDKQGRKVHIERYVDDKDQQQVELTCGNVKAHRRFSVIQVDTQICQNASLYDQCSSNIACGCLQSAHTRNDSICSYLYVTCSELNACAADNQTCLEPEHECVTHSRCHNVPLCYLMNMATETVCPPILTTTIGGNEQGPAKNQLIAPQSVVVDDSGTVYVLDYGNDRVTRWSEGSTSGNSILGRPGWGDDTSYISRANDLVFDRHGNLYVVDNMNVRILKFTITNSACSAVSTSIKSYITVT